MEDSNVNSTQSYVDSLVTDIRRMSEQLAELRNDLDSLTVDASSPDRLVCASVDGRGRLVGLTLDPRIYRVQDSVALAGVVCSVVEEARVEAVRRATEIRLRAVSGVRGVAESCGVVVDALTARLGDAGEEG